MPRRQLVAIVVSLALSGFVCSAALGAKFSRPVRLPGDIGGWSFVIAPDGEAMAVRDSERGALIYPISRSMRLGPPVQLAVAGGYGLTLADGALDDHGRIALAFVYFDHTYEAPQEPHAGPSCCDRVAIASWRLGEAPPEPQTLTPKLGSAAGIGHAPSWPQIVLGRQSVTALWTLGAGEWEAGEGERLVPLKEAFGPFGGPYRTRTLMTARHGIWDYVLTSTPSGLPIASWVDDGNKLHTVTGIANGALHRSLRSQALHGLIKEASYGFTTSAQGETLFAYQTSTHAGGNRLMTVASRDGTAFSRPRLITTIPPRIARGQVMLGPRGTLLAYSEHWTKETPTTESESIGRFAAGALSGPFGPSVRVSTFPGEPIGFVGGQGEAVAIYRDYRHAQGFLLDAVIARAGHRFGRSHVLDPGLFGCGIEGNGETELEPLETGPRGDAILLVTCEDNRQYAIRYTP